MKYLLLRSPSANRVYTQTAGSLALAELTVSAPFATNLAQLDLAGVDYVSFEADDPDLGVLASQSTALALFAHEGELLRPVALPNTNVLDEDLVTIPKYQGKTNEQFTKALLNVTLAALERDAGRLQVLDPMCGRGTTLTTAWLAGHDAFGVEVETKAFEALAAFITTWARRKRLKHTAGVTPVRRDGKAIGKRFDAELKDPQLAMTVFTGDTRDSGALFGKKKFDAIVTDAPYGVVHGASAGGSRNRSPEALLREAIPVWAGMLKRGGALGISWNTYSLSREGLAEILSATGLRVRSGPAWDDFAHRVDSSIVRDLIVATS